MASNDVAFKDTKEKPLFDNAKIIQIFAEFKWSTILRISESFA
jgi:hypothetical protein